MLILLPPSESKHARRRGLPTSLDTLSFPQLNPTRDKVIDVLARVSATPQAADVLGVSPSLLPEVERNTRLRQAPAVPVAQLYTGVLYDALDHAGLDAAAKRRANRRLVVVSAVYGALRMNDKVAPYRASMAVNLPGIGPLARAWRTPLAQVLSAQAGAGVIVDCRSSTYVAAWQPAGAQARAWVSIRVPGATHMAKHTRGLVARALSEHAGTPRTPQQVADALASEFDVQLHPPERPGRPWVLDATARP